MGKWGEASADLVEAAQLEKLLEFGYLRALVCLTQQKGQRYREVCSEMLGQLADSSSPEDRFYLIKACVLAPNAIEDYRSVIQLARQRQSLRNSISSHADLGTVLFRAGDFDDALEMFEESNALSAEKPDTKTSLAYSMFFRAMTHQRLEQASDAKEWLQRAIDAMDRELEQQGVTWTRKLTLELLRKEATELIGMDKV